MDPEKKNRLKALPQVGTLLETPEMQHLIVEYSHELVKHCCNEVITQVRKDILDKNAESPALDLLLSAIQLKVQAFLMPRLRRVINATGILLHTGLGRAPLLDGAYQRAFDRVRGACALELDLSTGKRGDRQDILEDLLMFVSGAEGAAVVNNNAAAVLLALNTLANRGQTIVSRGQLIEIGGSFRLPEVMRKSGTRLVEVGTTNRTYLNDYLEAVNPKTKAVLIAHSSNYRVKGFVHEPDIAEVASKCKERDLYVIHDLGGGVLVDLAQWQLPHEPIVHDSLAAGVHVVTFSGDKVLGGPQCGILVGNKETLSRIRKNPMMRALRPDKFTLALLEETLKIYMSPKKLRQNHPVLARLTEKPYEAVKRAKTLYANVVTGSVPARVQIEVVETTSQLGSGALPLEEFPSAAIRIKVKGITAATLASTLRAAEPPVIGYVQKNWVYLDVKAVMENDFVLFVHTLRQVLRIK